MLNNPYNFRSPLIPGSDDPVLVPRTDLIAECLDGLRKEAPDPLVLEGPRRAGKSTFLNILRHAIPSDSVWIYVYLGHLPSGTSAELAKGLTSVVATALSIPADELRQTSRPELELQALLARASIGANLVLALDGTDLISSDTVRRLLSIVRAVYHQVQFQRNARIVFVLAGSISHFDISSSGPDSPFNIGRFIRIPDLTQAEAEQLIARPLSALGFSIDSEAVEAILDQAQGVAFHLQMICYHIVNSLRDTGTRRLSRARVADLLEPPYLREDPNILSIRSLVKNDEEIYRYLLEIYDRGQIEHKWWLDDRLLLTGFVRLTPNGQHLEFRNEIYRRVVGQLCSEAGRAGVSIQPGLPSAGDYDLAKVRSLLQAAFTVQTLRRFCQDRPAFRPIVNGLGPGHGLDDVVDLVIDYCRIHLRFGELLAEIEKENRAQYERFLPYRA